MKLIPKVSPEFNELLALARDDKNLANAVRDHLEAGLPFVVADVDNITTSPTGDRVFTYQLPERLLVLIAAARTRKRDAMGSSIGRSTVHGL